MIEVIAQTLPDVKQYITDPAIALLIVVLFASIGTLVSGKLVIPKFVYDKELENNKKLLEQLSLSTESNEKLAAQLKEYNDELRQMRRRQDT